MAVKLRVTNEKGLFHEGGEGVVLNSFPSHITSGSVKVIAANETLTLPGAYSVSGTRTLALPEPTSCPGGLVSILQTDANATTVTPAQDCTLMTMFHADGHGDAGDTVNAVVGNSVASAGAAGESICFVSDGMNWQVMGLRGTWNLS